MSLSSQRNRSNEGLDSPRSVANKTVCIVDEPEHIEPSSYEVKDGAIGSEPKSPKLHRASISGKKLTGRSNNDANISTHSLIRQMSSLNLDQLDVPQDEQESKPEDPHNLLLKVAQWLEEEKSRRVKPRQRHIDSQKATRMPNTGSSTPGDAMGDHDTEESLALRKLEAILGAFASTGKGIRSSLGSKPASSLRRGSIARKKRRGSVAPTSSDTEALYGDEFFVPNVEATLDNSKTMAYTGGAAEDKDSDSDQRKDKEYWATFKQDIVRLTHTLRLKGWRRVPIENGSQIDVERLSGALTNAVYVVSPPKPNFEPTAGGSAVLAGAKRPPMKLLLRVYGPQVEHLIDREAELAILRRLARKRIGPCMLGTFSNGRFEEFFNARTLTPEDLRIPDTSKQIAKRMRELHDGIELLEKERDDGPFVFINWDKWVDRCQTVISWLDEQVLSQKSAKSDKYTRYGLICGVEWPVFRQTVEKYREYLLETYGGRAGLRKHLVFAHNDAQYGNLMRLKPSGQSPLLHPANEHKQLVVIDFEYANANTRGLEFANHFTEWCYNYHHPEASFLCNTQAYPTAEEQHRFIRSYVMHRPQFNPAASATPKMEGREKTYISDFMLDARTPPGAHFTDYQVEEREREDATEKEIQHLMQETKLWRIANSAQWVAWGIVQAKVPELDEALNKSKVATIMEKVNKHLHPQSDPLDPEVKALQEDAKHDRPEGRAQEEVHEEGDGEDIEEFDYLAYSQERAMFFWGDCLQLGLVKEDELPQDVRAKVKLVKY